MRLGGFVIHGNSAATLPDCLSSLTAVADEVVAVDSGSNDGSAAVVERAGVRAVRHAWQGYGAARAVAVRALPQCDWVLYLDSDERLEPEAIAALQRWKRSGSMATAHLLPVHDWAELPSGRFLYRTHHRARLVRREAATWAAPMIVHEGLSQPHAVLLAEAPIEHRFATDVPARGQKEETYALLWAVRAHAEARRQKWPWLQRPAMFFRDAFIKGAAFRGGLAGIKLAWAVAAYHSRKYERLSELKAGSHPELTQAFERGDYARIFERARQLTS
ncbi:MAG: glycosyltransferase family 2 protein [Archangiaceae bacterium]|nr:glycosyltransferase family 2 protein [Archangiaceae bacterium]